jgi:sterol desaturase/sphingolipid hydroxylase (fatty acid hydroxylase superfamily)
LPHPWTFGWIGKSIIVPPAAHILHHAKDPAYFNKNFGGVLPIWDRVFGTWILSTEIPEFGTNNAQYNGTQRRFAAPFDLLSSYIEFWKALNQSIQGCIHLKKL